LSSLFPVLGLFISLLVRVVLVLKNIDYGLALLICSLILSVFSGFSLRQFEADFVSTTKDYNTYELALVISLIPILASFMKKTGMIDWLIAGIKGFIFGRAVLSILPALLGVLSMPGGAYTLCTADR